MHLTVACLLAACGQQENAVVAAPVSVPVAQPCAAPPEPPPRYIDMLSDLPSSSQILSSVLADQEMLEAYNDELYEVLIACM